MVTAVTVALQADSTLETSPAGMVADLVLVLVAELVVVLVANRAVALESMVPVMDLDLLLEQEKYLDREPLLEQCLAMDLTTITSMALFV